MRYRLTSLEAGESLSGDGRGASRSVPGSTFGPSQLSSYPIFPEPPAMPAEPSGYIKLHRKILENEVLAEASPLCRWMFVWLLLKANWKDHGKLKRGQVLTSIPKMRQALRWKVGFRFKYPTRRMLRRSYEGLVKGHMVSHMKTTRGMIVTILNYEKYQDIENNEGPHEGPHEGPMRGHLRANDKERKEEIKKEEKKDILAIGMAFSHFWKAYPRKVKKPDAEKAWKQIKPTEDDLKKILHDIEHRWKDKDIQFTPYPGPYLRNRRWEDEEVEPDPFAFFAKETRRDERTDVSGRDEATDGFLSEEDADV